METFEWLGTLLSISGSFLLALKLSNKHVIITWIFWIISGLIFTTSFFISKKYGLMTGQAIGIIISLIGLFQWIKSNHKIDITKYLLKASILLTIFSLYHLFLYFKDFDITQLEWISGLTLITASLIMASNTKYSIFAWVFWLISNSLGAYLGYINNMMSFFVLQIFFIFLDIIGIFSWAKKLIQDNK